MTQDELLQDLQVLAKGMQIVLGFDPLLGEGVAVSGNGVRAIFLIDAQYVYGSFGENRPLRGWPTVNDVIGLMRRASLPEGT